MWKSSFILKMYLPCYNKDILGIIVKLCCFIQTPTESESNCGANGDGKNIQPKTKRVRTTFTEEQVSMLQANFNLDCNPDGQDLERIARMTGLTKRVTQVS